jgi:hypothetical protein
MDVISLWQFLWHGAREAPVSDAYYIYHYKYTYSGSMKLKWISKLSILWWSDHVLSKWMAWYKAIIRVKLASNPCPACFLAEQLNLKMVKITGSPNKCLSLMHSFGSNVRIQEHLLQCSPWVFQFICHSQGGCKQGTTSSELRSPPFPTATSSSAQ